MNAQKPRGSVRHRRWAVAVVVLVFTAVGGVGAEERADAAAMVERAAALVQERQFDQAAAVAREALSADPDNRRAKELLAFALESSGDLEGERRVRSGLVAQFPDDWHLEMDYGRVLERSGDERAALDSYLKARRLYGGRSDPELDAAIDRVKGRTAVELATPLTALSDPDATARRVGLGTALPLGSHFHLALLADHAAVEARTGGAAVGSDVVAATLVWNGRSGASVLLGPRFYVTSPADGGSRDWSVGCAIEAHAPLGPYFEIEASGDYDAPWDEAAVALLHGGRTTGALARAYSHLFRNRLLLQVGGRWRRLTIVDADPASASRPEATQSVLIAGADVVAWRRSGAVVRGGMRDARLVAPAMLASALTVSYRHFEVSSTPTPEFVAIIGLVPRSSVDEISSRLALASPGGWFGVELQAGIGRDGARDARTWRAGGTLVFVPTRAFRVSLGYEESTEYVTGLEGRRSAATVSLHAQF